MKTPGPPPPISQPFLRLFARYATSYLARHFHSIRLLQSGLPPEETAGPLVIFLNHAAWWDPLVCLFLARKFYPKRVAYAPMEATALKRYRFFLRLGFFAVESGTTRGASAFLRTSEAILQRPESALFLTPQAKFADVRAPLWFASGLDHLAARCRQARFVPLAIEYSFWEERKPEILLAFGQAKVAGGDETVADRLARLQGRLAAAVQAREPNDWKVLLRCRSGVSRPYDLWRWARARLRGEAFHADHGRL